VLSHNHKTFNYLVYDTNHTSKPIGGQQEYPLKASSMIYTALDSLIPIVSESFHTVHFDHYTLERESIIRVKLFLSF